ncbi:LysE family translocator [Neptuniibacter sp.]|uniref:LysE family translocator n=1 Tax=Neptuniibacter sp. TaxID=1962643 RepID=UPI003B596760
MDLFSSQTLITFIIATVLLGFTPGPDNIFVLIQSALYGRKAGIIVTLGLCTGLVGHTLAVTLGLAAIFKVSVMAFTALKVLGAGYLIYLAWRAFTASCETIDGDGSPRLSHWQLYKRGVLMSSTNPKLAIFFLAFLPQFADPSQGSLSLQLMSLGGVFIFFSFWVMTLFAILSGSISEQIKRSDSTQKWINRLAGTVFVALALRLLATGQSD